MSSIDQFYNDLMKRSGYLPSDDTQMSDEAKAYESILPGAGRMLASTSAPVKVAPSYSPPNSLMTNSDYTKSNPNEIDVSTQVPFFIAGPGKNGEYKTPAAEAIRTNRNIQLGDLMEQKQKIDDSLEESRARYLEKEKAADEAVKNLSSSLKPYTPTMDYAAEIMKMRDQNDTIKDPERDPISQAILALGPALGGIFFGESGALAAPQVSQTSRALYDKDIGERKSHNAILRKNISDRITSLAEMQKSDVNKYVDTSKLGLDKDKALAAQSVLNARYNKEDVGNQTQQSIQHDKLINDAYGSGVNKASEIDASNAEAKLKASTERARIAKGSPTQELAKIRLADMSWNRNLKDTQARLEAGNRIMELVDEVKNGNITDSKNIRNTLTADLMILTLPGGMRGTQTGLNKAAIDNAYTKLKDALSYISSNPESTIPAKYLDQIESEAGILANTYGQNMNTRYKQLKSSKDKDLNEMYDNKYNEVVQSAGLDPATGRYLRFVNKHKPNTSNLTRQQKIDLLKAGK